LTTKTTADTSAKAAYDTQQKQYAEAKAAAAAKEQAIIDALEEE
jgi:hypothetical protein